MPTVAYLANLFPSPVEPYVPAEIRELRSRGFEVIPGSARASSRLDAELESSMSETVYLQPVRPWLLVRAAWLCLRKSRSMPDLLSRVLMRGKEGPGRRARALLHTWLGAYYALLLQGRGVEHIHVHHGYFASWIAMAAARLLGISFSITLHGSDLLLHKAYLDTKLQNCSFCVTISEFNRQHILEHFPNIRPDKIIVQHLGIAPFCLDSPNISATRSCASFVMLAVGRLHPVKNHAFLVRACRQLKDMGTSFRCLIAGEGQERTQLERLIRDLDLQAETELLGHLSRAQLDSYYALADLVVLTSRSEGIPLVLMEAMARGKVVLAPNIAGIPELVLDGKSGFLYRSGSLDDFVSRVEMIHELRTALAPMCFAAQQHVSQYFDRDKNLAAFGDLFLARMRRRAQSDFHENPVLQQI